MFRFADMHLNKTTYVSKSKYLTPAEHGDGGVMVWKYYNDYSNH